MTTIDDQGPMDTTEASRPAGVSCAAASGYADWRAPFSDGRPQWCELCDCVTINRTVRPMGKNESLEEFSARVEHILRAAYNLGADWTYDADCLHCDTGRKHTEVSHGGGSATPTTRKS